jgi:hypothetical protein
MSKRALSVSLLTAGLSAGLLAGAISPAAAQGHPVGGDGNIYFLSGAINETGQAAKIYAFGEPNDVVLYGDWDGDGIDSPMARRGNVYFVADQHTMGTQDVFVYGDAGDEVLVGDWDGNGADSIAVRRGNHFFVKNDNRTTGKADSEFFYGDAGDKVLVGNWDGLSKRKDKDGNFLINKDATAGSGLSAAGTDFATDTLMVQRGNRFFVKNDTETGVADYTFYFGDAGDDIIVGDWATKAHTDSKKVFHAPADADGADQLAVRRGLEYHQSSELQDARDEKKNPSTQNVFHYGNADDTVFVASRPGQAKGQLFFLDTASDKVTVDSAPAGIVYDVHGVPLVNGYNGVQSTTANQVIASVLPAVNNTGADVTAYDRNGNPVVVAQGDWFSTLSPAVTFTTGTNDSADVPTGAQFGGYLFDAKGLPLLANGSTTGTGTGGPAQAAIRASLVAKTEAQLKASIVAATALSSAPDTNRPKLEDDLKVTRTGSTTLGFVVFTRQGDAHLDTKALWAVTGDGFGVRR